MKTQHTRRLGAPARLPCPSPSPRPPTRARPTPPARPCTPPSPGTPPQVGDFGGDNRAGIDATLHRISAMRNRSGRVVGLTCRVGRAITGSAELVRDLIVAGHSILFLGRPGERAGGGGGLWAAAAGPRGRASGLDQLGRWCRAAAVARVVRSRRGGRGGAAR